MDKNYYPAKPEFKALTSAGRERLFGKFRYQATQGGNIKILGNWTAENIVKVKIPQLIGVYGAPKDGVIYWHKLGVEQIKGFFQAVEDAGLLHLIISWAGSYNARFIRGSSTSLSNHSWATAFDINAPENWLGQQPAAIGKKGSLLQLVEIAHQFGFYWGGHFQRLDGMHFELAVLNKFPEKKEIKKAEIPTKSEVVLTEKFPDYQTETVTESVTSISASQTIPEEQVTNVSQTVTETSSSQPLVTENAEAPAKEGSTANSVKLTVLGVTVPAFVGVFIKSITDLIAQGYISAAQIGEFVINYIKENQKYVFWCILGIILLMIIKKICKQISFWITQISKAIPWLNSVEVKPNQGDQN